MSRYIISAIVVFFINIGLARCEERNLNPKYYANSFLFEAAIRNHDVSKKLSTIKIEIVDVVDSDVINAVGVCFSETNKIQLERRHWEDEDDAKREQLMFHELGHCVLGRSIHTPYPGVMYWQLMASPIYIRNRTALLDELFDPNKKSEIK